MLQSNKHLNLNGLKIEKLLFWQRTCNVSDLGMRSFFMEKLNFWQKWQWWALPIVAAVAILGSHSVSGQDNILNNGGFENGSTNWNGNANIQVPNGWTLSWAEDGTWATPSTRVWGRPAGRGILWRDGSYNFAAFARSVPIFVQLKQTVGGLKRGEVYNVTVPVFPEIVQQFLDPKDTRRKVYSSAQDASEVRLIVVSGDREVFNSGFLDNRSLPVGRWTKLSLNFAPLTDWAEIRIEMRAKYPNQLNAMYMDGLSMRITGQISPELRAERDAATAQALQVTAQAAIASTAQSGQATAVAVQATAVSIQATAAAGGLVVDPNAAVVAQPILPPAPAPEQPNVVPVAPPAPAEQPTAVPVAPPAPEQPAAPVVRTYIVQSGDSLARIARLNNVAYNDLLSINNISNPNLIRPGQVLILP